MEQSLPIFGMFVCPCKQDATQIIWFLKYGIFSTLTLTRSCGLHFQGGGDSDPTQQRPSPAGRHLRAQVHNPPQAQARQTGKYNPYVRYLFFTCFQITSIVRFSTYYLIIISWLRTLYLLITYLLPFSLLTLCTLCCVDPIKPAGGAVYKSTQKNIHAGLKNFSV